MDEQARRERIKKFGDEIMDSAFKTIQETQNFSLIEMSTIFGEIVGHLACRLAKTTGRSPEDAHNMIHDSFEAFSLGSHSQMAFHLGIDARNLHAASEATEEKPIEKDEDKTPKGVIVH